MKYLQKQVAKWYYKLCRPIGFYNVYNHVIDGIFVREIYDGDVNFQFFQYLTLELSKGNRVRTTRRQGLVGI